MYINTIYQISLQFSEVDQVKTRGGPLTYLPKHLNTHMPDIFFFPEPDNKFLPITSRRLQFTPGASEKEKSGLEADLKKQLPVIHVPYTKPHYQIFT